MDYKEKYEKALEKMKGMRTSWETLSYNGKTFLQDLESIFPELKEGEDEKIRKKLLSSFKGIMTDADEDELWYGLPYNDIIAWLEKQNSNVDNANKEYWRGYREGKQEILDKYAKLEKQGEQSKWKPSKNEMDALYGLAYITNKIDDKKDEAITKLYQDLKREFLNGASYENMFPSSPVNSDINIENQGEQKTPDKVEPKFHEGEWVTDGKFIVGQIISIDKEYYHYICNGIEQPLYIPNAHKYHLWTIKDAKDGDVLAVENMIFIFKTVLASHIVSYCKLFNDKFDHFRDGRTCCEGNSNVHPATKEQCDALIKAMNDAGYTFDFEKKELKKIEAEELTEQKHAGWSEEDKEYLAACIEVIDNFYTLSGELKKLTKINVLRREYAEKLKSWLKSLKPQSKYEQEESVLHWESGHPEPYKSVLILRHGNTVVEGEYNEETGRWYQYGFQHYLEDNEVIGWMDKKSLLSSFNSQLYWKPTEEQIMALKWALNRVPYDSYTEELHGLLEQLKQL